MKNYICLFTEYIDFGYEDGSEDMRKGHQLGFLGLFGELISEYPYQEEFFPNKYDVRDDFFRILVDNCIGEEQRKLLAIIRG